MPTDISFSLEYVDMLVCVGSSYHNQCLFWLLNLVWTALRVSTFAT